MGMHDLYQAPGGELHTTTQVCKNGGVSILVTDMSSSPATYDDMHHAEQNMPITVTITPSQEITSEEGPEATPDRYFSRCAWIKVYIIFCLAKYTCLCLCIAITFL